MLFLTLSDTHGKHRLLKNLPPADVIIHAGDITKDGSDHSAEDFMKWFSKLDYEHKIFIAGNHDFYFEQLPEKYIRKIMPPGLIYLNDSGITLNGINIWGSPVTPEYYNWAFQRGMEISKHWRLIPGNTDILITHGPPHGILDKTHKTSAGCASLLKKVKQVKPMVHVFGHIHEAYGCTEVNGTKFINASLADGGNNLRNAPIIFEL